jgi:hypothetical protein
VEFIIETGQILIMVLEHTLASMIAGFIIGLIAYLIYKKASISIWGYMSGFLSDLPVFLLSPFGVTNLQNLLFLSHTVGIFVSPIILIILDIVLIGMNFLRRLKPFYLILPNSLKAAIRIENVVEKLQKYNAIPKPVRVKRIYFIGVVGGIVHLLVNLLLGKF